MKTVRRVDDYTFFEGKQQDRKRSGTGKRWYYKRMPDEDAHVAVTNHGWEYCPKTEWKTNVRNESEEWKRQVKKAAALQSKD